MINKKQKSLSEINKISKTADFMLKFGFAVVIVLTSIYPLMMILGSSLTENETLLKFGYNVIPKVFSFNAYRFVLSSSSNLINSYGVTVLVTSIGTFTGVIMMAMYAYAISRKGLKYRKFFSLFAYVTFVFNGGLVPFYFVYSRLLNLGNTLAVLIIPYLVDVWYIVILRTFFASSIPDEVLESAKIDGASEIRTFIQIVIPLAIPALASVTLFTILKYWNDFQLGLYFIDDADKFNVQYMLYRIMGNMEFMRSDTQSASLSGPLPVEAARMAMCVLGAGPLLLAYPFFQQYFIKGLTMGAIKG